MLEDVKDSASVAHCRQTNQRRKKRGRLLYSTPKELSQSRMRRSNVVPCLNKTSTTLDFLVTDTEDSAHRSSYIRPILEEGVEALTRGDVDVDKDCPDQVSPRFQLTFSVLFLAFKVVWLFAILALYLVFIDVWFLARCMHCAKIKAE
jgi:hypothetical protein